MEGPILVSIQVGLPRFHGTPGAVDLMDQPWVSGFFKEPLAGPVHLGRTNLAGDGQADLSVHGGPDKAVLAYAADHYPAWREELGRSDMPFGAFGENFTIRGLDEERVCIGDTFALGEVRVQVAQPRQPCWKLARRWRLKTLPKRVVETGRSGWYFRVLCAGTVEAGMVLQLLERPCPAWTVTRANQVMHGGQQERDATAQLAACPFLALAWREYLLNRL